MYYQDAYRLWQEAYRNGRIQADYSRIHEYDGRIRKDECRKQPDLDTVLAGNSQIVAATEGLRNSSAQQIIAL
jgi:hypothetical protein